MLYKWTINFVRLCVSNAVVILMVFFLIVHLQIASLKKTLKTHLTDIDEDYTMDYKDSTTSTNPASTTTDSRIKKNKCKIMKPSTGGKSWFKF